MFYFRITYNSTQSFQNASIVQSLIASFVHRMFAIRDFGDWGLAQSVTYDVALYSRALSTGAAGDEPVAVEIVDE